MTEFLDGPQGRRIAYDLISGRDDLPGVVFLGGFRSDMRGTKAEHLAGWARAQGLRFLRLDYSGHGESSGRFEDGSIGDWAADAMAAVSGLTTGPQVLVGSSMGGWIALLLARAMPDRVAGLVGIAAAPDFTENGFWANADEAQREALLRDGQWEVPSDYSEEPDVITRRLIEDGRDHLVLDRPLPLPFKVRLLQGTADAEVPVDWALRLLDHADCPDMRLLLVKGADHRLSDPDCLTMIEDAVAEVMRG